MDTAQYTELRNRLDTLFELMANIREKMARQEEIAKRGDPIARREIAKLINRMDALEKKSERKPIPAHAWILGIKLAILIALLLASVPLTTVAGVATSMW